MYNPLLRRVHVSDKAPHYSLSKIISGEKHYEGRLATKVQEWNLKPGMIIDFYNEEKEIRCIIKELLYFEDFGKAYDALGSSLMSEMDRESVVEMYNTFWIKSGEVISKGDACQEIKEKGVVCIGIERYI